MKKRYLLFNPGPVNLHPFIKKNLLNYNIGHREEEFSEIYKKAEFYLFDLTNIKNAEKFSFVFINGSSSLANEIIISNYINKYKFLILRNGEFGDRLFNIAEKYNIKNTKEIDFSWGKPYDLNKIAYFLEKNKEIKIIMMVYHETSTGMLNHLKEVSDIAKKYNKLLFVDAVSAIGSEQLELEKWNIDLLVGTTGKSLGALPGTSFIIGKKNVFEETKNNKIKSLYLNLYNYFFYKEKYYQTPNTPSVYNLISLYLALKIINKTGKKKYQQEILKKANQLRNFFEDINLNFFIDRKFMGSTVTSLYYPKNININSFHKKIKNKNIIIYKGKKDLEGKIFQVANMGYITNKDINHFINTFTKILS